MLKEFPFLIGRIRTSKAEKLYSVGDMFPFLIGRIRTKRLKEIYGNNDEFPFLIGRIRTEMSIARRMLQGICFHSS